MRKKEIKKIAKALAGPLFDPSEFDAGDMHSRPWKVQVPQDGKYYVNNAYGEQIMDLKAGDVIDMGTSKLGQVSIMQDSGGSLGNP